MTWVTKYATEFPTVGDATALDSSWSVVSGDPGNDGHGYRSANQVSVVTDPTATTPVNASFAYPAASGRTVLVGAVESLQAAINAANSGDIISFSGDHVAEGTIQINKRIWLRGAGTAGGGTKIRNIQLISGSSGLWLSDFRIERLDPPSTGRAAIATASDASTHFFRWFNLDITGHGHNFGIDLNHRQRNTLGVIHNVRVWDIENVAFRLYCDDLRTWGLEAWNLYRTADLDTGDVDAVNWAGANQHHSGFWFRDINEFDTISVDSPGKANPSGPLGSYFSPHPDGFQHFRKVRSDGSVWQSPDFVAEDGVIDYRGTEADPANGGRHAFTLENNGGLDRLCTRPKIRRVKMATTGTGTINVKGIDHWTIDDCRFWHTRGKPSSPSGTDGTWGGIAVGDASGGGPSDSPDGKVTNCRTYAVDSTQWTVYAATPAPQQSNNTIDVGDPVNMAAWTSPTVQTPTDAEVANFFGYGLSASCLRLAAENVGGRNAHAAVVSSFAATYQEVEMRVRVTGPSSTVNPVIYQAVTTAAGDWMRWIADADSAGASPQTEVYDGYQEVLTHSWTGRDLTEWNKIVWRWEQTGISARWNDGPWETITTDTSVIPHVPCRLGFGLDAMSDTPPSSPVYLDVDYVVIRHLDAQPPPLPPPAGTALLPTAGLTETPADDPKWHITHQGTMHDWIAAGLAWTDVGSISTVTAPNQVWSISPARVLDDQVATITHSSPGPIEIPVAPWMRAVDVIASADVTGIIVTNAGTHGAICDLPIRLRTTANVTVSGISSTTEVNTPPPPASMGAGDEWPIRWLSHQDPTDVAAVALANLSGHVTRGAAGVAGIAVSLRSVVGGQAGSAVQTSTTDASGGFSFSAVPGGSYVVRYETADGSVWDANGLGVLDSPVLSVAGIDITGLDAGLSTWALVFSTDYSGDDLTLGSSDPDRVYKFHGPGNAYDKNDAVNNPGFGWRDPRTVTLEASTAAQRGSKLLTLTAQNAPSNTSFSYWDHNANSGAGGSVTVDISGQARSGGLNYPGRAITYGRYRFRARCDRDPSLAASPVILLWRQDDDWSKKQEVDWIEGWANRDTRAIGEFNLHYLDSGGNHQVLGEHYPTNLDDWHVYTCTWTPSKISIQVDDYPEQVVTTDASKIPDGPMTLAIQLDLWNPAGQSYSTQPSIAQAVRMELDWLEMYELDN